MQANKLRVPIRLVLFSKGRTKDINTINGLAKSGTGEVERCLMDWWQELLIAIILV